MDKAQIAFYIVVILVIAINMWKMKTRYDELKRKQDEENQRIHDLHVKQAQEKKDE